MAGISIHMSGNLDSELAHLKQFPKEIQNRTKQETTNWYNKDFKPYVKRLIRGFKGKDIPAKNSEPYATHKSTGVWTDRKGRQHPYNVVNTVSHSLGEVGKAWGKHKHPPGQLLRGVMAVKPKIEVTQGSVKLRADFNKPFYLPVVHDGLYNLKKAYPFIDAALVSKFEILLKKIEDGIVIEWED